MCAPIVAAALFGAGGLLKYAGEKKAANARERTFNRERTRQQEYSKQQQGRFEDSLASATELANPIQQKRAADARENTLAAAIVPAAETSYLPGSSSAPSVVKTASDNAGAAAQATSSQLARTLAALGGTTDQLQSIGTTLGRNGQLIDQLAGFKVGSANVLDAELRAAAQKGAFLRGLGGLAQTIGKMYAMGGMGAGGAAANAGQLQASAIGNIANNPGIF